MLRRIYQTAYMMIDVMMLAFTYYMAVLMLSALNVEVVPSSIFYFATWVIIGKVLLFLIMNVYNFIPKFYSFEDLFRVIFISLISNLIIVFILNYFNLTIIPKSSFFLIVPLEFLMLTIPRFVLRTFAYVMSSSRWIAKQGVRTCIIGGGQAGEVLIKEMFRNKNIQNIPIVILDDDVLKVGKRLLGIRIFGPISELEEVIHRYHIQEVAIAIKLIEPSKLQFIYDIATSHSLKIKKMDILADVELKPEVKEITIEDLLNRVSVELDNEGIEQLIKGKNVLVTGGGGSIGSELVRQIAQYQPKQLIIFDIYENNAYEIQMELERYYQKRHLKCPFELKVVIGSVYNEERLKEVYQKYQPHLVFHAAAYKHVPLMENNFVEAIRTNVIGTYYAANLASEFGVERFVLVSSDKAVRSTNIMGATKRFAEKIIQNLNQSNTKFSIVRFGNVLNSNGSVVPLFKKQILDGGPVNVTHPDITRYFMTISEAVSLILQSSLMMKGNDVFVLDMGEPIKIVDLAEKMIRLMGYVPNKDIMIQFIGLRPGEKLYEELLIQGDVHHQTDNPQIYKEEAIIDPIQFDLSLIPNLTMSSKDDIIKFIQTYVKSYHPGEETCVE
jgi:FlaA1/EpsC-like NDP-sugar epimerase